MKKKNCYFFQNYIFCQERERERGERRGWGEREREKGARRKGERELEKEGERGSRKGIELERRRERLLQTFLFFNLNFFENMSKTVFNYNFFLPFFNCLTCQDFFPLYYSAHFFHKNFNARCLLIENWLSLLAAVICIIFLSSFAKNGLKRHKRKIIAGAALPFFKLK